MAAGEQVIPHRFADPFLHPQAGQIGRVLPERTDMMPGGKTRRRQCRFWQQPEFNIIEQQLQRYLILQIAAGNTDRRRRPAVFKNQRGGQGNARPFARLDTVGMVFPGIETLQAGTVGNAGAPAGAGIAAQTTGGGGHHITPAIGHAEGGGAAADFPALSG